MGSLTELFAEHGLQPWLESTRALVVLAMPDGTPVEWNAAFGRLREARASVTVVSDLLTSDNASAFDELALSVLRDKRPGRAAWELLVGREREMRDCLLVPLPDGRLLFVAEPAPEHQAEELVRLATELQETKRELEKQQVNLAAYQAQFDEVAHTDPLTFVSNHRQIVGDLQREVFHAARYKTPLTISMVDIDHFKQVNDRFGHPAGDKVLWALADTLREGIRQSDLIGRYGGEEFLILLPGTPIDLAIGQAERLLKAVRALALEINGETLHVAVSLGIAQVRIGRETWEEFLERADQALYRAKAEGRDRWFASEPVDPKSPDEAGKKTGGRRKNSGQD